jgi:TolB-like protein/Tfp pilus assembly protein PilF
MPALISGFEYDIFISYRQKDNKYDGWVTEFVTNLKKELEATFKEDISIYFDENPHDGLLESHQVDKSLEGKLKCLIFIPIISQTYCDTKSFAWQNEFCVFNRLAKEDQYGRDIRLYSGNVASRILPVRIHDLDANDLALLAQELGGPLRSIDFVYKEAGVNRPLRLNEENPSRNLNQTLYRNQINKVANAIKEIIQSLSQPKSTNTASVKRKEHSSVSSVKKNTLIASFLLFLVIAGYFLYSRINQSGSGDEMVEKSIAVLPFVDMTPQSDMEYLGDGLAEEIINSLTSIRELKVIGRTSSFQFKGEQLDLRDIGEKLQVGIILEGSIQKYEDHLRITAQLVRTKDNFHIWSERYDLEQTNIFKIQDNIAANIVDKLKLTLTSMEKTRIVKKEIDQETYNLYLKGLYQYKAEKFSECIPFFSKVIQLDSTYAPAYAYMGLSKAWVAYRTDRGMDIRSVNDALFYAQRSIELDPDLAEGYSANGLISWMLLRDYAKARTYFEKSIEVNPAPAPSYILNRYGYLLVWMGDFEKASQLALKAMRLDPVDYNSYVVLYFSSLYSGKVHEAEYYLNERKRIFGKHHAMMSMEIRLHFAQGEFEKVVQQCDSLVNSSASLDALELSFLTRAYLKLNRLIDSETVFKQLKAMVSDSSKEACFPIALVYADRHEIDSCFAYLEMANKRREQIFRTFKIEPVLKDLHKDPRYINLYQESGFDKY